MDLNEDSENEEEDFDNWVPDPVDADPSQLLTVLSTTHIRTYMHIIIMHTCMHLHTQAALKGCDYKNHNPYPNWWRLPLAPFPDPTFFILDLTKYLLQLM